jgi:hypothetical protein
MAKASAVSDECVANIRTVRAFAMEDAAAELYSKEIDESNKLHEWLGLGIGVFQGLIYKQVRFYWFIKELI